ncbi:MAG: acyltransferase family protein [Clostridia bacterium]|nr:acyltransferase family protein [Clostridia bacterium]
MKFLDKYFTKEPCNTGRQFELDWFRFVLIYRLAIVHVFVDATPPANLDVLGIPYYFDSVVGGVIGATRFMIVMGIGLSYTRHSAPKEVFRRGIKIGIIGIILNVFRYLIPSLIGYSITGDADKYITELPYLFFGNDILQFASLAMILMSLLLYLKLNPPKIMGISLVMSVIGTLFRSVDLHNNVLNVIAGHVIGIETVSGDPYIYSDFPLMIWFVFYAFGYLFGYYYQRLRDKEKFYRTVSPVCLVISVAFCIWEIIGGFGMMMGEGANVFYHMHTGEAIICIMACIGTMMIFWYVSKIIPQKLRKPIERVSRNVNTVYCIHWVLVWWVVDLLLYCVKGNCWLKPLPAYLLGLALSIASMLLAEVWNKFKIYCKRKKANEE